MPSYDFSSLSAQEKYEVGVIVAWGWKIKKSAEADGKNVAEAITDYAGELPGPTAKVLEFFANACLAAGTCAADQSELTADLMNKYLEDRGLDYEVDSEVFESKSNFLDFAKSLSFQLHKDGEEELARKLAQAFEDALDFDPEPGMGDEVKEQEPFLHHMSYSEENSELAAWANNVDPDLWDFVDSIFDTYDQENENGVPTVIIGKTIDAETGEVIDHTTTATSEPSEVIVNSDGDYVSSGSSGGTGGSTGSGGDGVTSPGGGGVWIGGGTVVCELWKFVTESCDENGCEIIDIEYKYICSPVTIDLDNDGLELISYTTSIVTEDFNGDGTAEPVGWVGPDDGILIYDGNENGQVDGPEEYVFTEIAPGATDLEALAVFDTNQDGILDASDAEFGKFMIWQDLDQDGVQDAGELRSLADVGLVSLNLTSDHEFEIVNDNYVFGRTTATFSDGSTREVGDVGLSSDTFHRLDIDQSIPEATRIEDANGNKFLSWNATTPFVFDVAENTFLGEGGFDVVHGGFADDDISNSGNAAVLLHGGFGNDLLSGGSGADILVGGVGDDQLLGNAGDDMLTGGIGADVLNGGAGFDWANYKNAEFGVELSLDSGTGTGGDAYGDTYSSIEGVIGSDLGDILTGSSIGAETLIGNWGDDELNGLGGDDSLYGDEGADSLSGGLGDDYLNGGPGADVIDGGDGVDTLDYSESDAGVQLSLSTGAGFGGHAEGDSVTGVERIVGSAFDDDLSGAGTVPVTLEGGAGNDHLAGADGDDILKGGDGNDLIEIFGGSDTIDGGAGDDHFIFHPNFGTNTLVDVSGTDVLEFDAMSSDISFTRSFNSLIISVEGQGQVTIQNWYSDPNNKIETIQASDRSYTIDEVEALVPNTAPYAMTDFASAKETVYYMDVLANDYDAEGDEISFVSLGSASGDGTVEHLGNGILKFTILDVEGSVSVGYTIEDEFGLTSSGTAYYSKYSGDTPIFPGPNSYGGGMETLGQSSSSQDADGETLLVA